MERQFWQQVDPKRDVLRDRRMLYKSYSLVLRFRRGEIGEDST